MIFDSSSLSLQTFASPITKFREKPRRFRRGCILFIFIWPSLSRVVIKYVKRLWSIAVSGRVQRHSLRIMSSKRGGGKKFLKGIGLVISFETPRI